MPTFRFHAIEAEKLMTMSSDLLDELIEIFQVPEDYFNFEIVHSSFINRNRLSAGFPIVEVLAFERDVEIEDRTAVAVSKYLKRIGFEDSELFFIHLKPRNYYNNGEHY